MRRVALALSALALFPAAAAAQTPPPAPTPTPVPPAPAPPPPTLATRALGVFGGSHPAALTKRSFTVRVAMKPFLPNETAILRVYRGKRKIRVKRLKFTAVANNTAGVATLKVKSALPGTVSLKVTHDATATVPTVRAKTVRVRVVRASAAPGAKGPAVRLLQSKLARLHYVTPRSGVYDAGTQRAVMAYRKVTGMSRTYVASEPVFSALLAGRGRFRVRHPKDGHHVEARLNQQVLALIDKGKVQRIYMMSSGKPSTPTVRGKFRVYLKTPGTNAKGMVDSNYFIRGYAIHGYFDVPPYNASHGCLRVPIPNARSIYDWLRIGDVVWVEP
jgi:peptidoglycan hydrolase-like protein with peptidoglycan-binding domain